MTIENNRPIHSVGAPRSGKAVIVEGANMLSAIEIAKRHLQEGIQKLEDRVQFEIIDGMFSYYNEDITDIPRLLERAKADELDLYKQYEDTKQEINKLQAIVAQL